MSTLHSKGKKQKHDACCGGGWDGGMIKAPITIPELLVPYGDLTYETKGYFLSKLLKLWLQVD